ncbi:DUF2892 domain-containing protein [Alkalibaculum sp. M08DMB]|uniref:DUF2892 domain-containing protein n=1 Tax=Alkalibaculum sporogenes TaxID=2655001 RepID=A0A6A7KCM4_9FIRM|nr:DUF2892 domain-containing protein [Alkalibaculum sporogenes]MPW26917.1 DUF2892 domain-containing protein [Alkalibaculum sporogenes]
MVSKNMGLIDSYASITCGLTIFGMGITRKSKFLISLGAMKTAEGITGFCPLYYILGMSTKKSHNIIGVLRQITK